MDNQENPIVNNPPTFSGKQQDLESFITRVELTFEAKPNQFATNESRIRFIMSYMYGKPLEWAACLKRNQSPILNSYEDFIRELRNNFGGFSCDATVANSKLFAIRQKKIGCVMEYIMEFQKMAQNSDFNESAKIFMFTKGLHYQIREKLAFVDPNPNSLGRLFTEVVNIENIIKKSDLSDLYYFGRKENDPMELDLMRIKHGRSSRYYPDRRSNYVETKDNFDEERKKGVCFTCKEPGHRSFNCPNRTRPKSIKRIKNSGIMKDVKASTSLKKIKSIEYKKKDNVIDFYISTNDIEEQRVKVLIDSGADLNFIHPDFAKLCGIKLDKIKEPFGVSGLGYGVSKVRMETEKCILRHKNHYETIQLYALRIPDVDVILGLPWIEKHSPTNFHNCKKLSFSSGYCARNCNYGKRNRKPSKKNKGKTPIIEEIENSDSNEKKG